MDQTIDLNYFDHPDDLRRLVEVIDRVEATIAAPVIQALSHGQRLTPRLVGTEINDWIPAHTWSYHPRSGPAPSERSSTPNAGCAASKDCRSSRPP